jgi:Kef-type K+ transport system membrane component KefB
MPSFGQLTLIIVAGLFGPLLASSRRVLIPVVVGELLAGVALGKTGAGLVKADNPTIAFLGDIGFAVLMMVAGMHVPLRNRALLGSLRLALVAVLASAALGAAGGVVIDRTLDVGHPAVWAVLLATGSAAIVLPALQEAGVSAERAILAMAWATVADVATIVAVPLVMNPPKAVHAGLGALAVAGGAVVVLLVARLLAREGQIHSLRRQSARKAWALDLRVSLVALFALCALAQWVGTSIMIAGFAAGLIVAVEGGPRRLSDQVTGVANGFLVPVFFVVLGASVNVRALVKSPDDLELAAALIVGMVAVHVLAGLVVRSPVWTALIVTAQLGVPAAVAKLGLAQGVLTAGQAAAIIAGALASLGVCAAGIAIAKRATPGERDSSARDGRSPTGHSPEPSPAPSPTRPSTAP